MFGNPENTGGKSEMIKRIWIFTSSDENEDNQEFREFSESMIEQYGIEPRIEKSHHLATRGGFEGSIFNPEYGLIYTTETKTICETIKKLVALTNDLFSKK